MVYRFWFWLLAFVKGRCGDAYVAAGAVNLKCPMCQTWTAETNGPMEVYEKTNTTIVRCRQCQIATSWCLDGPAPYVAPVAQGD